MDFEKDRFPLINNYAGFSSKGINNSLRKDPQSQDIDLERRLNIELEEIEPYSNRIAFAHDLYTGIPFEILSKWYLKRISTIIEFPNFLSSSKCKWCDYETCYEIRTNNFSKGRDIQNIVCKDSEKEVLFKSRSLFKIILVDHKNNTIHLDEVYSGEIITVLNEGVFLRDKDISDLYEAHLGQSDNDEPSLSDKGEI